MQKSDKKEPTASRSFWRYLDGEWYELKAKDAILIDSTEKSIEEVKDEILKVIKKQRKCRGKTN